MKLVLLSGGSGKRLWPLSNDARSKQFLRVLENEEGQFESMVQRVWGQLERSGLSGNSFIATGASQIEMMQSQIGHHVPLIIEPERRDTFPAITLAAAYLYSRASVNMEETIAILPVDPYVEDYFFNTVRSLEKVLLDSQAELALIGVTPTYPSSKYGYIIPQSNQSGHLTLSNDFMQVSHFCEKPSELQAVELIKQQALWNCGVFAFKLGYILDLLLAKGLPIHYEELLKHYRTLPAISFDYEVVEKAKHVAVVPYSGYWKDLGTWNTLTEEMNQSQIGPGTISEDCANTHLVNEIEIPVSIVGLSNIIVAASPDGILVADKNASPRIKDYIAYNQGPKYEERNWGWLRVLDDQIYEDGRCVFTKRVCIQEGKHLSYRMQVSREEVWTVVKGEGEFVQNGNLIHVRSGNILHIPQKSLHSIRAVRELEIIVVQTGIADEANQMIELYNSWDEICRHCRNATWSIEA